MPFSFRPAKRGDAGLLISLAGGTGSGKTYSALRLATGLAEGKPFCGIDTENGRMAHYADDFRFDHGQLDAPFRPDRYIEAIEAAVAAGYRVIVIDSASHEHAGEGGLLDWHEEELERMAGSNWNKREACKMAAWIQPKMSHKRLVQRLLGLPAHVHLILCLRAEEKVAMEKDERGKMQIVPKRSLAGLDGWIPICEKGLPFEMTMSFLLHASAPGVLRAIKLQAQHRALVPLDRPVDERVGAALAAWAKGASGARPDPPARPDPVSPPKAPPRVMACRKHERDEGRFLVVMEDGQRFDLRGEELAHEAMAAKVSGVTPEGLVTRLRAAVVAARPPADSGPPKQKAPVERRLEAILDGLEPDQPAPDPIADIER